MSNTAKYKSNLSIIQSSYTKINEEFVSKAKAYIVDNRDINLSLNKEQQGELVDIMINSHKYLKSLLPSEPLIETRVNENMYTLSNSWVTINIYRNVPNVVLVRPKVISSIILTLKRKFLEN